jgi:hypothetical protein
MIQVKFKSHLQKETHHAYRLIEHMVRAGFTYPPLFYEYYAKGEQIVTTKLAEAQYESRFLPIITRPPVPFREDGSLDGKFYGPESLLHGLRLIQFARSTTAAHVANREISLITIGELCNILNVLFSYNKEITRLYVKELESYEIFRIGNVTGVEVGSDFAAITTLPKCDFLLDECILDAAYLNLCAMRTLVPRDPDSLQLFRAAQLGQGTSSEVQRWIIAKLINSISIGSLFVRINEEQRRKVEKTALARLANNRERDIVARAMRSGLFSLCDRLADTIATELSNIMKANEANPMIDATAINRAVGGFLAQTRKAS